MRRGVLGIAREECRYIRGDRELRDEKHKLVGEIA
jgi:hypothetical protein